VTKLTSVLGHGFRVLDTDFKENPLNGRRDTAKKVPQVMCPSLLTDCEQTCSILGHGGCVLDLVFQKNSLNGRGDTANKVLCSSNKVPFIIDQL